MRGGHHPEHARQALQDPLDPFLTPTPSHRLTRQQAYKMIARLNEQRDALVCIARLPDETPVAHPDGLDAVEAVGEELDAGSEAQLQPEVAPQLEQR